jgi:SulP family sulfate permease
MSNSPGKTRGNLVGDLIAGLTTGVANIPDAMASAILAGANPVQGLYAVMIGTPLGAIFGSSAFMTVAATSALAMTAGMALEGYSGDEHARAMATLAVLTGVLMVAAGLLKLGRLLRFVANSVVIGFLTGVSINVILSQLSDFTGYSSGLSNKVLNAVNTFTHLNLVDAQTTAIGLLTVLVILLVDRTRLRNFSMLVGMVAGSAAVILFGWAAVQQVNDVAIIPTSLPLPQLPDFALMPSLLADALALAIIALVQGAGVSKAYPNPDGTYPNSSRDFVGQGAANIGAGLLRGMPIGGSVSSTALNISSGAKSRWANIFAGLLVVAAVLLFSGAVSLVAMPAMAALLIVAGFQSIKLERIQDVWDTGWAPRAVMVVTLLLTLAVPLQRAVFLGVLLSILFYFLFSSSKEVRVTALTPNADGSIDEGPAPAHLPNAAVTVLQLYGNMTVAGAETMEAKLPVVGDAERPVVILRMRAQEAIGSGFVAVLERYSKQLQARGGKLMLAGVNEKAQQQLARTETTADVLGHDNVYAATTTLGASTRMAYTAAQQWLQLQGSTGQPPASAGAFTAAAEIGAPATADAALGGANVPSAASEA